MAKGRWIPLTSSRTLVLDVCALSRKVPLFPAEREMNLKRVSAARATCEFRISWTALFTRAFALMATEQPALRRVFMGWPWPHFYEHAFSNASIAVHRDQEGEDRVCWAQVNRAEEMSLTQIQQRLSAFKQLPIPEAFPKQWRLSKMPFPIRRLMWRLALRMSGRQRAKSVGTFSVSALAGLGVHNRFHPTILSSSLSYGPIDLDGNCLVTLICDHRVFDGYRAAICLERLESILNNELIEELKKVDSSGAS